MSVCLSVHPCTHIYADATTSEKTAAAGVAGRTGEHWVDGVVRDLRAVAQDCLLFLRLEVRGDLSEVHTHTHTHEA